MADNYIVNNVDSMNLYQNIMGVPSRRRIVFGAACILFVLTLIVIAFAVMNKQNSSRLAYTTFQSALNISMDPCVDFYNFSCGLWAQNNPLSDGKHKITAFTLLQDNIDKKKRIIFENTEISSDLPRVVNNAIGFYNICTEQDDQNNNVLDRELLIQNFDRIGGWPVLNMSKWDENTFDWVRTNALLIKYFDVHSVIGVYLTDTDKSRGKHVIYLKPTNVFETDYVGPLLEQTFYSVLKSLNYVIDLSKVDDFNFIQSAYKWQESFSIYKRKSNPLFLTIRELSQEIPEVDWLNFVQLIANETLHEVNESVAIEDTIAIESFDSLKKVVGIMNSGTFTKLEVANLFGWFAVKDIWMLIPDALQIYAAGIVYEPADLKEIKGNQCFKLTLDFFQCSFDYLFVKNISHAGIKDGKILINQIESVFQEVVRDSNWIDEETKNSVFTKLDGMKHVIGFPSYLNSKTEFDNMYKNFPVMGASALGCYFQVVQYYVKMKFLMLKDTSDQMNVILPRSVTDVSAYYIVHKNTMVFPISLHNPPFYYPKGPWYLNFGAVGTIIGHEMMHGFDNFGINGTNLRASWLSNASSTIYKKRAECFKDQYTVYDSSGLLINNGSYTLRENIADNEGLRLAYEAYKKHVTIAGPDKLYKTLKNYSPDQMFFIAYGTLWCSNIDPVKKKELVAESHGLPDVRINRVVSNSKSFAAAFNCPKGSPMNPAKKCSIW